MFMSFLSRLLFLALFGAMVPAALVAQQTTPSASQERAGAPDQEQVQSWLSELQQLHLKLERIQASAAQDPQLQSAQVALGNQIREAMEKVDPQLPSQLERVEQLEAEAGRAQQAGDEAKLQQLAQEAEAIQIRFLEARNQVFQQPEMAARLEAFQARMESKMAEVDPEAPQLIKRFQELEEKLAKALQAAQGS
jgi:chromosome segregation ATPase